MQHENYMLLDVISALAFNCDQVGPSVGVSRGRVENNKKRKNKDSETKCHQ